MAARSTASGGAGLVNWLDAFLILIVIWAAVWGALRGFLTAGIGALGGAVGAVFGLFFGPKLAGLTQSPGVRGAIGVVVLLGLISIGVAVGAALGRRATRAIASSAGAVVNQILGAVVSPLVVALVMYLVAVPLASVRQTWLAGTVRSSATIQILNKAVPAPVRSWPSALGKLFNDTGFPQILDPLGRTPVAQVADPDPTLSALPPVREATKSIVKVHALAPNCSSDRTGTAFVVGPRHVLTNAHVVAGSSEVRVQVNGSDLVGAVVGYDAQLDVAMVRVPELDLPTLRVNTAPLSAGASVIVSGFPLNEPLTTVSGRVQSSFGLDGPDIYQGRDTFREVYVLKAQIRQGNSGGPLLTPDGAVAGVVFASAPDVAGTGYALTSAQVAGFIGTYVTSTTQVGTGGCLAN